MQPPTTFDFPVKTTNIGDNLIIEDGIYAIGNGTHLGIVRICNKTPRYVYGFIEYTLDDITNKLHIDLIEVRREHRRKNYATKMLKYVTKMYGEPEWGAVLPDGDYLKKSEKWKRDRIRKKISTKPKRKVIKKTIKKCKRK